MRSVYPLYRVVRDIADLIIQVLQWRNPKESVDLESSHPYLLTDAVLKYLPLLIDKVEKICEENGLRNDSIVMRMTGCPNGCARPYIAGQRHLFLPLLVRRTLTHKSVSEVAFVGKAVGTYLMLLGGGYYGQRLNKIYRGLSKVSCSPALPSMLIHTRPFFPPLRERDGARNPGHSRADDQTVCS